MKKLKVIQLIIYNQIFVFAFLFSVTAQNSPKNISPSIQKIVSELRGEMTLHLGSPVGYAGIPETNNKYYKLYQKLSKNATNDELLLLTTDKSNTIILYSFLILYSRYYSRLKEIFLNHISNNSIVWIAGGCTGAMDKVNSFMLHQLNPAYLDSRLPYLTQKEYDEFEKQIGEIKFYK